MLSDGHEEEEESMWTGLENDRLKKMSLGFIKAGHIKKKKKCILPHIIRKIHRWDYVKEYGKIYPKKNNISEGKLSKNVAQITFHTVLILPY